MKQLTPFKKTLIHLTLTLIAVIQGLPLLMVVINSLRKEEDVKIYPLAIPESINLKNYVDAWVTGGYFTAYGSSIFVGIAAVLLVCTVTGLAAYGLVKLNIFGKKFFMVYFVVALSIPAFAYLVPEYFIFTKLKLTNTLWGLVIVLSAGAVPFNLMLMRAFFLGIPRELEESGKVDGCSEVETLWHITLPMAKPIITTVALLVFVGTWNDFIWSNTLIQNENLRTVATRYYRFVSRFSAQLTSIYAAGLISIAPICVLFLLLQKNFIEGITQGGLKG